MTQTPTDALRLVPDDQLAALIQQADDGFGYSMEMVRLVDGVRTYRLKIEGQETVEITDGDDNDYESIEACYALVKAAKNKVRADAIRTALAAPASPPVEQPFVRTPNEDDRLRRALYRLLERHDAGPDVLSIVGSLWDTLDQGECTDLIEDWLITGKTIQVEGDIEEMLASIPESPASPLPEGGLPPISLDGPHTPNRNRQWLARQLLDSNFDDDEAYSIVRHHPAVGLPAVSTGDAT